ncbi:AbrB family transcriptional regulator [Prosthecomicrobium pneumaticum]|uniref:Ammonia monooxygenase n=1 Tax=Prosthecomicrobium pneumaticum TaxID=81895 RepID=A0A7W9CUW8_9HYPH|nr:AbrB family transcriptional regulator [Prosthecomicrobium pneumaticum]MBB5752330.1 hypothetical protein [Prosthecomicrobium pneumaticum]
MDEGSEPPARVLPPSVQWAALVAGTVALVAVLEWAALPAALLLGPMIAAILLSTNGGTVRPPPIAFLAAQAVVGCLVARSITPSILVSFLDDWPLLLAVVLTTLAASSLLGFLMSRWRVLPGTTGVWGSTPGAASAMVIMAGAFGADARLVAFMQYLRVVCVAGAAALIAGLMVDTSGAAPPAVVWFPPLDLLALGETLALAAVGGFVGVKLRVPAGSMLVPLVAGAVLHGTGLMAIELPPALLALAYAIVGWRIGGAFTRQALRHAFRALPQILGSILLLIAFCGGLAWLLAHFVGIDPLTAYLATSPGGMDTVAIIAAASHVDLSFVMALQTLRFLIVLLLGPALSRLVSRRLPPPPP